VPRDAARRHDVCHSFTSTNGRIHHTDGTATQAVSSSAHWRMSLNYETYSRATKANRHTGRYLDNCGDGQRLAVPLESEPRESPAKS
jgi:hypothetical protein